MAASFDCFLGFDFSDPERPCTYAALDKKRKLLAIGGGKLVDALAYAAGQSRALAAINAPACSLTKGVKTAEAQAQKNPVDRQKQSRELRQAEYELMLLGVPLPRIYGSGKNAPAYIRRGLEFYPRMENLGYQHFTENADRPRQWVESNSEACFKVWLGTLPLPAGRLEGRIQRQLALFDLGLPVADAMLFFEEITRHRLLQGILPVDKIHLPAELNALACAQLAWLLDAQPSALRWLGHPAEGQIVIPDWENLSG